MIDHRSYTHNLSSCEIKAWKKFRPNRASNPWPVRYRCSALPTSQLGAGHVVSSYYTVEGEECEWIHERSYSWTAEKRYQDMIDHRVDQSCLHIFLRSSNIWPFIYSLAFLVIYGYITNSHRDQFSVGLIAQLVEHCTGIAQVMG